MIDEILFEAEEKMEKAVHVAREDLAGLRTGRANASAFARLVVDYYGAPTPIPQMATVNVPEARMAIIKPYDGKPATVGNGVMVALAAASKQQVDAVHAKALALGGKDEGAPGPRGDGFYAGYFRDLDGNKLNAFYLG